MRAVGSRCWLTLPFSTATTLRAILPAIVMLTGAQSATAAATFVVPPRDQAVVGYLEQVTTKYDDTLSDIARRYNVGFRELRLANPDVDAWLPGDDAQVLIPMRFILPRAPRKGIVLNLAEMRLYYYPEPRPGEPTTVITFPVSIGREGWSTPVGTARIVSKVAKPTWYPPKSVREEHAAEGDELPRAVPPGPDNPLGEFALRLSLPGYLLHGTNRPFGIGMEVTHGCIRLYPEDVEWLFEAVPVGTPVTIVDQSFKLGWQADMLYLEIHPPFSPDFAPRPVDMQPIVDALIWETRFRPEHRIDWERVTEMARRPSGAPMVVASLRNESPEPSPDDESTLQPDSF